MTEKFIAPRAYGRHDGDAVSESTGFACEGPSLTVQSQRDEADINTIVRNFGITGKLPENPVLPQYGDFEGISDFRTALDAVKKAQENFMTITADIRARFDNDPQKFLEFCSDERNREEMQKLGLLKAPVPESVPERSEGS